MQNSEDTKVLSKEEMEEYFKDWDNPIKKEEFFNHNIRLGHFVAKKYINTGIPYEELFQLSLIGLWKGVRTFDPSKGFEFATYASRVMHNEILMFIRKAKKHSLEYEEISTPMVSLYSALNTDFDGNTLTLEDILESKETIDEDLLEDELRSELKRFMDTYNPKHVEVIKLHMQGKTQKRIASTVGVSQSYVSRIINNFKKRFKRYYEHKTGVRLNL